MVVLTCALRISLTPVCGPFGFVSVAQCFTCPGLLELQPTSLHLVFILNKHFGLCFGILALSFFFLLMFVILNFVYVFLKCVFYLCKALWMTLYELCYINELPWLAFPMESVCGCYLQIPNMQISQTIWMYMHGQSQPCATPTLTFQSMDIQL